MIDKAETERHVLDSIKRAEVIREPFAHFRLENIFPQSVYQTLIDNFPEADFFRQMLHQDAMRPDGTSTRSVFEFQDEEIGKLGAAKAEIWTSVRDILYSAELQELVFEKFKQEIDLRVSTSNQHQKLNRDTSNRLTAYPRPGLFRDTAGYRITPHPDTPLKIVTMQFYLPRDDSQETLGTSLYLPASKLKRALTPWSGKYVPVKKFPFLPNSGYAFAVTQDSWHGRETINGPDGDRYSIMTCYLREDVKLMY